MPEAHYITDFIVSNYDKLPDNVRGLLFKMAENGEGAEEIASTLHGNPDEYLPDRVRNELLLKLADKDEAAEYVSWTNFEKLPDRVRNELLLKLADKEEAQDYGSVIQYISWTLDENSKKVPHHVRNKLLKKIKKWRE